MSLWDWLRKIFGTKTESRTSESRKPGTVIGPTPQNRSTSEAAQRTNTDKMINSITLSTDLSKLFLIDNDRCIAFPLDNKRGVVIGLLNGQLAVVTGVGPIEDLPDTPGDGDSEVFATARRGPGPGPGDPIRLVLSKKDQITVIFHEPTRSLSVIGVLDIVGSAQAREASDRETTRVDTFSLKGGGTVTLRRVDNALEVIPSLP